MTVSRLFQDGKLEQACPDCGTWEAAHYYCSKCSRPMAEADWYQNGDQTRRQAALAEARKNHPAPSKAAPGRPRRSEDME